MKAYTYTCVVCPKSCTITLAEGEDGAVACRGEGCRRGAEYAMSEHCNPLRMLTTTVRVTDGLVPRVGVIGSCEIPKELLAACLQQVYALCISAPVRAGDVLLRRVLDTECDVLAATDIPRENEGQKEEDRP